MINNSYNPDVLSCLANLSSDEVFTPPQLANEMLNHLPPEIWQDKNARFLDPFTKSGVFLREITSRLNQGLEKAMPDRQKRVDHILTKQVFGIGITQITSLLARRSVYCSKHATGKHSIAKSFTSDDGNIWFQRLKHTWDGDKCKFCGAGKSVFDRAAGLETHAYAFIHTDNIKTRLAEIFGGNMQFDVIIGNPPYQLASDGGTRDVPIYQLFVDQAKKLEPRFLAMVIPSRWMASGLGLSEFRQTMLGDRKMRELVDYPAAADVFPGVEVKAGVCYFLRDASHNGDCKVTTIRGGEIVGPVQRNLGEYDVFVRDARGVAILHKVLGRGEASINTILARDKEFGWTSNFDGFHERERSGDVPLYYIRQPWAWLIVNGYKDIENRVWAAKLRGPVLIHAGLSKQDTTAEALAYIKRHYRLANLPDTFETGGIVGIAEISDCVEHHRSQWFQGPYGWTLANARRLPFKPVKGQLKFFTPKI